LYSLFTKQGTLPGEKQQSFAKATDPSFLRSFLIPQSRLG
jgi:hypothetical protein